MSNIDYQQWIKQPLIWAERCRGRGLVWTPTADWFINDPLGPTPHSHDDATEILYMAQGQMKIEVGGSTRIYQQGDLLLMPPDKFHNYWFAGTEPACTFVVVAPNHRTKRWRTADFPAGAHEEDGVYANISDTNPLPSNEHFDCEQLTLAPGEINGPTVLDLQDRIVYVIRGAVHLEIGHLSGVLTTNQYQHIPATADHTLYNPGYESVSYLSFIITDPFTSQGTESTNG